MKFTISKKDLLNALKLALINPAERVKDYALITCNPRENRITLQSTDGAMHLKSFIPIEPGGVSGSAILPIGTTILALSDLPKTAKILTLTRIKDTLCVTSDGCDKLILPVIETVDDFPDFPDLPDVPLYSSEDTILWTGEAELAALLDKVTYALPKTKERENFDCVLLESCGEHIGYSLTATDGYRLARAAGYADCISGNLENTPLLLPGPCVRILRKMLKTYADAVFLQKDDLLAVYRGAHLLVCPLASKVHYPDYRSVIPEDLPPEEDISIEREDLIVALKHLLPSLQKPDYGVIFTAESDELTVSALFDESPKVNIAAFYKGGCKSFALNAKYVLDAVKQIPDAKITLDSGWDEDPVRIRTNNPDTLILIKPLRCPVRAA